MWQPLCTGLTTKYAQGHYYNLNKCYQLKSQFFGLSKSSGAGYQQNIQPNSTSSPLRYTSAQVLLERILMQLD